MTSPRDETLPLAHLNAQVDEQIAMQLRAQAILQASGWFEQGIMLLDRIRTSMVLTDDVLCWYIPAGVLGEESLKGATLWGLPIYEATAGTPPGIGFPLPVCSRNPKCTAHVEPPREVTHLWTRWARQHKVEGV